VAHNHATPKTPNERSTLNTTYRSGNRAGWSAAIGRKSSVWMMAMPA
jgi:hypothetical protein